jgi:GTPase SAR1 family protein
MPNAKDAALSTRETIVLVGPTGSGKTTQIWSLPGRKFAYIFDPNALTSLRGLDLDYEEFLPDAVEMDATLKGFNKGAKSDKPSSSREPTVYNRWIEDLNAKFDSGFFDDYDWLIIDSITLMSAAIMDRQMYINNRYGGIEDLGDYRIVGSKLAEVFRSLASMDINIFATGHITSFQDEKTKKIETLLDLPGKGRSRIPLLFANIWLAHGTTDAKGNRLHEIQTAPEARGLQVIRSSIKGLDLREDVTIADFANPEASGIGAILKKRH